MVNLLYYRFPCPRNLEVSTITFTNEILLETILKTSRYTYFRMTQSLLKDNQRFRAGLDSLAKNNKRRNILKDRLSRILVLFKIIIRKA
jgi:hypothetical protein